MKTKIEYWDNGNVYSIINKNEKGQLHGEYKRFHDNGQLWEHCFYEHDKLHGRLFGFDRLGKLIYYGIFKDGECLEEHK